MNLTAYKGFTIAADAGRFFFACGSSAGYSTMNNVKGAITKFLTHKGVDSADALYASLPIATVEARIEELEAIEQPVSVIEAGDGGDFGVAEMLELEFMRSGLTEAPDSPVTCFGKVMKAIITARTTKPVEAPQSRNKREGKYSGKMYSYRTNKARHWRTGPDGFHYSLKEHAALNW